MTDMERRIEAALIEWLKSNGAAVEQESGLSKIEVISGFCFVDDNDEGGEPETITVDLATLARHIADELERRK